MQRDMGVCKSLLTKEELEKHSLQKECSHLMDNINVYEQNQVELEGLVNGLEEQLSEEKLSREKTTQLLQAENLQLQYKMNELHSRNESYAGEVDELKEAYTQKQS
eukprot:5558424-Ditylum_brightwellii.AAC.1